VILLRDAPAGIEILMMRRVEASAFGGGAYVFPGGRVDAQDLDPALARRCLGMDEAQASALLDTSEGALGYWIAAIRECFEESGLLLAVDHLGHPVDMHPALEAERAALVAQSTTLLDIITRHDLRLTLEPLVYFSHWITQAGRPRRFDTRFFMTAVPSAQVASHDGAELDDHVWINPSDALERHRRGEFHLMFPTRRTLEELVRCESVEAALTLARSPRPRRAMTPLNARGRNGPALLVPGDYPFTEVSLLDPTRSGERSCELLIGRPAGIGDRLVRVTAPHPRDPALPGVNTYLLGTAETGIAVIDPGPADPHHREALLAHAAGAIRWIICTHTHRAHAGGAADLARVTGAQLIGCAVQAPDPEDVDSASLHFDHQPHDGERLALGGIRLDVIATPGHADNHLCFLAPDDHILFTGDHLAQGPHGTRVATAPGSMNGLIEAFRRLREYGSIHLAPGHGFLMSPAHEMFERAITDQVGRENRVLRALREASVGSPSELLTIAFHDIDEAVRTRWTDTLLAHLARLEAEGRARRFEDRWQSAD
jgi:glyoxylase-like metal-dependent hydrolase (beta-lactamase superfamily II)/8-oxo-dGTP pyrophosphatase MutT (NUDIX family)